jgi:hypothetical protein
LQHRIFKASATWCNIGQTYAIVHDRTQFAQTANQEASADNQIVICKTPIHVRIACLSALYLDMDLPTALCLNVGFALAIALGSTFPLEWKQLLQRTASVQLTVLALHA